MSDRARAVRQAFHLAKSPELLLFEQLPKALGYDCTREEGLEGFSGALKAALKELKHAHRRLLEKQIGLISTATRIHAESLKELRQQIIERFADLARYTADTQGLQSFVLRMTKATGSEEEWLENILIFLGGKPSAKWLDSDQSRADYRLVRFSQNLHDLARIRHHEDDFWEKLRERHDVYFLKSYKKGGDFQEKLVAIDKNRSEKHKELKLALERSLKGGKDKDLQLEVLAELVNNFLLECSTESVLESKVMKFDSSSKKAGS